MDRTMSLLQLSDEKALCVWRNGSPTEIFRIVASELKVNYHEFGTFKEAQSYLLDRRVFVLLVDVHHPRSRELVQFASQHAPDVPVILLLSPEAFQETLWADAAAVWDFISLPCTLPEAKFRVERALRRASAFSDGARDTGTPPLSALSSSTFVQEALCSPWNRPLLETVEALFATLSLGDICVADHSLRTAAYASVLAQIAGVSEESVQTIKLASLLHDIGKLGVAKHVLYKPDKLSPDEFEHIKNHVELGLLPLERHQHLRPLVRIVRHVHEHFDGSGYPDGLRGREIPLESRIIAVADAFDALTTDRTYRPALPVEEAMRVLRMDAGRRWDPDLVALLTTSWSRGRFRALPAKTVLYPLSKGSVLEQLAFLERVIRGGNTEKREGELALKSANLRPLETVSYS